MPDLHRLFRYHALANREMASALASAEGAPPRMNAVFAHLIGAELLWLERLGLVNQSIGVWPELPPADWPAHLDRLDALWGDALRSLEARGAERIAYVNSKGERWESRIDDVLSHLVTHGAHHRGQIIAALRAAGIEPPYLDLIELARRGRLEGE